MHVDGDGTPTEPPRAARLRVRATARRNMELVSCEGASVAKVSTTLSLLDGRPRDSPSTLGFELADAGAGERARCRVVVSDRSLYLRLLMRKVARRWLGFFKRRRLYHRLTVFKFIYGWLAISRESVFVESTIAAIALRATGERASDSDLARGFAAWLVAGASVGLDAGGGAAAAASADGAGAARAVWLVRAKGSMLWFHVPAAATLRCELARRATAENCTAPLAVGGARRRVVVRHQPLPATLAVRLVFPNGARRARRRARARVLRRRRGAVRARARRRRRRRRRRRQRARRPRAPRRSSAWARPRARSGSRAKESDRQRARARARGVGPERARRGPAVLAHARARLRPGAARGRAAALARGRARTRAARAPARDARAIWRGDAALPAEITLPCARARRPTRA